MDCLLILLLLCCCGNKNGSCGSQNGCGCSCGSQNGCGCNCSCGSQAGSGCGCDSRPGTCCGPVNSDCGCGSVKPDHDCGCGPVRPDHDCGCGDVRPDRPGWDCPCDNRPPLRPEPRPASRQGYPEVSRGETCGCEN